MVVLDRVPTASSNEAGVFRRLLAVSCLTLIFLGAGTMVDGPPAGASSHPKTVKIVKVKGEGRLLADATGRTLYTFTDESGSAVSCAGGCLDAWPPLVLGAGAQLEAPKRVKDLDVTSAGQVTHDGLPLYRYAGDSGAREANGDGISSFGGTWHVVKVKSSSSGGTKRSEPDSTGYRY